MQIEKTVFVSYRRTNIFIARSVYQDLRASGYDVFLDYETIDSGAFSQVILNQIAARAHFLIILTPSALERCVNQDDWLRREIEYAIDIKRNIVPLMFEDFKFNESLPYLVSDKLKLLPQYNGLEVPSIYFEEGMERLRKRYLNRPLQSILHPIPVKDKVILQQNFRTDDDVSMPTPNQLKAEKYFESGFRKYRQSKYNDAIADFELAITLNENLVEAYYWCGKAFFSKRDKVNALENWQKAIELNPTDRRVNIIQSNIFWLQENYEDALSEIEQGIILNPEYHEAYFRRGHIRNHFHDYDGAIEDYTKALELNPMDAVTLNNRGVVYRDKGEFENAISDFRAALLIEPNHKSATMNLDLTLKKLQ